MFNIRGPAILGIVGTLVSACVDAPVKPMPEATKRSVTSLTGTVSGIKVSDTSQIGARGSDEGARRGATQGAAAVSNGSVLGLLLMPVGAAVGGAKGAAEAQSEEAVDATRTEMRLAMQDTDFAEDLRARLASANAGDIVIASVTAGSAPPPQGSGAEAAVSPSAHVVALEYRLGIFHPPHVNPRIALIAVVTAQVQSPDRRQVLHTSQWTYCGEPQDFIQMGANQAALLKGQINQAAATLAEAIPYDLFVSKQPRPLKGFCMDFTNLPSGTGRKAPSLVY